MIPTLFGITVVSFCIMQLAPGDPLLAKLGVGGLQGSSGQTRDDFLIQKRDLKLDKPLLLNPFYFQDFTNWAKAAAHFSGSSKDELVKELEVLRKDVLEQRSSADLLFLQRLQISEFERKLRDPQQHPLLADAIAAYVRAQSEDRGIYVVPAAIKVLRDPASTLPIKIGLLRGLPHMAVQPFTTTYSAKPLERETPEIVAVWKLWWKRQEPKAAPLSEGRAKQLRDKMQDWLKVEDRTELFTQLEDFADFEYEPGIDSRYFVERLLTSDQLAEKALAALLLKYKHSQPLKIDVPRDATAAQVQDVEENWLLAHYEPRKDAYEPNIFWRSWYFFGDTQYAHMVWRLVTFQFGRSTNRTREWVWDRILSAMMVTAPLVFLAELVIYGVAIPLGVICSINRGKSVDRSITFTLFLLYSIPPFVAGMLFLLYLCQDKYLNIFPSRGLHSDGAEHLSFVNYTLDYLWHAALPVICLSLFSLATMAMYSRSSMLDVINQDYIRTARAKGLSEWSVILKHALRNGMIPIITLFASFLPAMLGGSVLIEYLFSIPGLGRLSLNCIDQKDFPTLMALIYIDAIVVLVSILITDLLYVLVDPRISFEGRGGSA